MKSVWLFADETESQQSHYILARHEVSIFDQKYHKRCKKDGGKKRLELVAVLAQLLMDSTNKP